MPAPEPIDAGTDSRTANVASFTRWLCRTNDAWAVDATAREALPEGWWKLARDLFDEIAVVMATRPAGMLVVHGLAEEGGGLAADLSAIGTTPDAVKAFEAVLALVEGARRISEGTCSICGESGRMRSEIERQAPRCDFHAGASATLAADSEPGKGRRRRLATGRRAARDEVEQPADDGTARDHRLYHLADVEAALGRRHRGSACSGLAKRGSADLLGPEVDSNQQSYLRALVDDGEAGCLRDLAHPGPASLAGLDELQARAPHMAEVAGLVRRHLQAAIAIGLPTSIPAVMVLGAPGTGKSWFMSRLAALLGLPYRRHPMNGQSLKDGLAGAHPTWRNAQPGLLAKCLLAERVANPLVLVDEVDKAGNPHMDDPYRALYDLLEPEGARTFTDEYLGFPLDASRVLWILAGNDLAPLPAPIVDRLTVIRVPSPDEAHLRAVSDSVYAECNAARRSFFPATMREDVRERLLGTDPRGIRKAVGEAMTRAAADGRRVVLPRDVVLTEPPRRAIGFR